MVLMKSILISVDEYTAELLYLLRRWPKLRLLISTPPDESLTSLEIFDVFHVTALSKLSAIDLVGRLRYDDTIKSSFQQSLNRTLYK